MVAVRPRRLTSGIQARWVAGGDRILGEEQPA